MHEISVDNVTHLFEPGDLENDNVCGDDIAEWSLLIKSDEMMKSEILKMEKLDTYIRRLDEKIKEAGDKTLQMQLRNRRKLQELQSLKPYETGELARNTERFFNLCPMKSVFSRDETNAETEDQSSDGSTSQSQKSQTQKLEKKLTKRDHKKVEFIERNKQLAACSMGSLPITDEEKQRLAKLMADIDQTDDIIGTHNPKAKLPLINPFIIDKNTKKLLEGFDTRLATINSGVYKRCQDIECPREELLEYKTQCINRSLHALAKSNTEAVYPIPQEEIKKLVDEYYSEIGNYALDSPISGVTVATNEDSTASTARSSKASKTTASSDTQMLDSASTISDIRNVTQDVIDELVKEAKATMPLFQLKNKSQFYNCCQKGYCTIHRTCKKFHTALQCNFNVTLKN